MTESSEKKKAPTKTNKTGKADASAKTAGAAKKAAGARKTAAKSAKKAAGAKRSPRTGGSGGRSSKKAEQTRFVETLKRCVMQLADTATLEDRQAAERWIQHAAIADAEGFDKAWADVEAELRQTLPFDIFDDVVNAVYDLTELKAHEAVNDKTNEVTRLFAVGVMAYGIENVPFASDRLTDEQIEGIVDALRRHVLDADDEKGREKVKIRVLDTPLPLTHSLLTTEGENDLVDILTAAVDDSPAGKSAVALDHFWSGYALDSAQADEQNERYGTRFRVIPVLVRAPADYGRPTLFKAPSYLGGWEATAEEKVVFVPGLFLKTPFSEDFRKAIAPWIGPQHVLHTSLLNMDDVLWELDQHIGVMRVAIALQRMMADYMIDSLDKVVMSFGIFTDHVSAYTECRIAFALKSDPDELLEGVPMPMPYQPEPDVFIRMRLQVHMMIESVFGMNIADALMDDEAEDNSGKNAAAGKHQSLEKDPRPAAQFYNLSAEPDELVRLYFTSTGRQVPLKTIDAKRLAPKNYSLN